MGTAAFSLPEPRAGPTPPPGSRAYTDPDSLPSAPCGAPSPRNCPAQRPPAREFKAKEERPGGTQRAGAPWPAFGATRARPLRTEARVGGRAWSAHGSGAVANLPSQAWGGDAATRQRYLGAWGRPQGCWISRVEARRTPIPAACFPRGSPGANRRHRRGPGFIYPDGRARPGNRNTEAFSCFLTAGPGREHPAGAPSTFQGRREKPPRPPVRAEGP